MTPRNARRLTREPSDPVTILVIFITSVTFLFLAVAALAILGTEAANILVILFLFSVRSFLGDFLGYFNQRGLFTVVVARRLVKSDPLDERDACTNAFAISRIAFVLTLGTHTRQDELVEATRNGYGVATRELHFF